MSEREMFEMSFNRPSNYFKLDAASQWAIDKGLGILDWTGDNLSEADMERFRAHYNPDKKKKITFMPFRKDVKNKIGKEKLLAALNDAHHDYLFATKITEDYEVLTFTEKSDPKKTGTVLPVALEYPITEDNLSTISNIVDSMLKFYEYHSLAAAKIGK